jgi:hypothetical protein
MQPQGNRRYAIDLDRPVHIRDHMGEVVHKYLDEQPQVWRDAQGRIVEPQPTLEN